MSEKIAVHCKTKEEWLNVLRRLGLDPGTYPTRGESYVCTDGTGHAHKEFQEETGYTIISAQEYLGEDVAELDQEKLCEYCRDHYEESINWHCEGIKCEEITEMYLEDNPHITTKENKMKSNDVNKNVAAVFGDVPGNDLLLVDKHFDSGMMERILMDKHKTAILKACKDAEAEAVKAEKAKK